MDKCLWGEEEFNEHFPRGSAQAIISEIRHSPGHHEFFF